MTFVFNSSSDDEMNGFGYVYTIRYVYSEVKSMKSNTVNFCTNVKYNGVRSSTASSTPVAMFLQRIYTCCVSDGLNT